MHAKEGPLLPGLGFFPCDGLKNMRVLTQEVQFDA